MKSEKETRMRLNTYKLVRKEKIEQRKQEEWKGSDKIVNTIEDVLFERSITELEWMLE